MPLHPNLSLGDGNAGGLAFVNALFEQPAFAISIAFSRIAGGRCFIEPGKYSLLHGMIREGYVHA